MSVDLHDAGTIRLDAQIVSVAGLAERREATGAFEPTVSVSGTEAVGGFLRVLVSNAPDCISNPAGLASDHMPSANIGDEFGRSVEWFLRRFSRQASG